MQMDYMQSLTTGPGFFVLEAARLLFPKVHFGLVDDDCVPVTLFEVQDLVGHKAMRNGGSQV